MWLIILIRVLPQRREAVQQDGQGRERPGVLHAARLDLPHLKDQRPVAVPQPRRPGHLPLQRQGPRLGHVHPDVPEGLQTVHHEGGALDHPLRQEGDDADARPTPHRPAVPHVRRVVPAVHRHRLRLLLRLLQRRLPAAVPHPGLRRGGGGGGDRVVGPRAGAPASTTHQPVPRGPVQPPHAHPRPASWC